MLLENYEDAPYPLSALRDRLGAATYAWLQDKEQEAAAATRADYYNGEQNTVDLFASSHPDDVHEEDEYYPRVQEWTSSRTDPDGVGGYTITTATSLTFAGRGQQHQAEGALELHEQQQDKPAQDDNSIVRVQYILSDAAGGHGDDLWAASRHVSNLLADPVHCLRLLQVSSLEPETRTTSSNKDNNNDEETDCQQPQHPLVRKRFIELGAGGGLPSWTALRRGARVVCTDQPIADRIRALAEAAERNLQEIMKCDSDAAKSVETALFKYASQAKVCPYSWGTPVNDLLNALPTAAPAQSDEEDRNNDDMLRFDVLVAADCVYMPECHGNLLQSIHQLIKRENAGVALLPFALHGNTLDENVWSIVQSARDIGFCVEQLETQQLTPQSLAMDSKRALVHLLRLTLP